ncbi:MAG TPA: hypothetical protein VNB54_02690 [Alphaproteobacteria bacterium]|nr:hypothetical protein [Alphaproteobacteria bacterium]
MPTHSIKYFQSFEKQVLLLFVKTALSLSPQTDLWTYNFCTWQGTLSSGKTDSFFDRPAQIKIVSPAAREMATLNVALSSGAECTSYPPMQFGVFHGQRKE